MIEHVVVLFSYFNTLDHIHENTTPQNILWCQKMDLSGIPPPKMDWESTNLPEAWKKFQQHVDLIFSGPLSEKDENIK